MELRFGILWLIWIGFKIPGLFPTIDSKKGKKIHKCASLSFNTLDNGLQKFRWIASNALWII